MRPENWLKHDYGTRQDPKIELWLDRCGHHMYGAFWVAVEMMGSSRDGRLLYDPNLFETLSKYVRRGDVLVVMEEVQTAFEHLIAVGVFGTEDEQIEQKGTKRTNTYIFSHRLRRDNFVRFEHKKRVGEVRALAGKKSGESRRSKIEGTKTNKREQNEREEKRGDKIRSDLNTPLPPVGGKSFHKTCYDQKLPAKFDSPANVVLWHQWLDYLASRGQTYKNDHRVKILFNRLRDFTCSFKAAVEYSIDSNYRTIYEPKSSVNGHASKAGGQGAIDRTNEEFNKLMEELHGQQTDT